MMVPRRARTQGGIVLHEFTTKPRNADGFGQTPLSAALASSVDYGDL